MERVLVKLVVLVVNEERVFIFDIFFRLKREFSLSGKFLSLNKDLDVFPFNLRVSIELR